MITNAIEEMERSVEVADSLVDNLNIKLQKFEEKLPVEELDQEQAVQVLELLDSVTEVKQEYDSLRKELQEVQHLQKEMNASLRYQIQTMNQTFKILKKKIEANPSQYSAALQRLANAKIH